MTPPLARRAGRAMTWRASELASVQVIFLVRLLVLARLLSPDDFGLLAMAMTVIAFLMAVTNFGMVPALVQRAANDPRHYDVAWTVGVMRALGVAAAVLVAAPVAAVLFEEPRAVPIIRALALIPLLDAMVSIRLADLTRDLKFRALGGIGVARALVNTVVAISLAPWIGVWALVAGVTAGSAAHLVGSYLLAPHRPRFLFNAEALAPLLRFGRWIFIEGILAQVGSLALRAAIARELGTAALGLFFLASNLAFLPALVASQVAGSVAFPLFVQLKHHLRLLGKAYQTLLSGVALLLVPASILLVVLAPLLVEHLLDERWAGAAPLIQVLALIGLLGLFGETVVPLFQGIGQPARLAVLEFIQASLIALTAGWLARQGGLMGVTAALLLATLVSQLASLTMLHHLLPRPFRGLGPPMLLIVVSAVAGGGMAWGVGALVGGIAGLVSGGASGAMIAALLLWYGDRWLGIPLIRRLAGTFPELVVSRSARAEPGS
jgi:O-antigen/teichoic acid export membrane protein